MNKLLTFFLLLSSLNAFAERETHGGGGLHCFNQDTKKEYVLLLDLWEFATFRNVDYMPFEGTRDEILAQIVEHVKTFMHESVWRQLEEEIEGIKKFILFISADQQVSISPPTDAQNGFYRTHCHLVGVAAYRTHFPSGGNLWIDQKLYNLMTPFHQAALILHEAVYKTLRDEVGVRNSKLARLITAELLIKRRFKAHYGENYICKDEMSETTFYLQRQWSNRYADGGRYVIRLRLINAFGETVHRYTHHDFKVDNFKDVFTSKTSAEIPLVGWTSGSFIRIWWAYSASAEQEQVFYYNSNPNQPAKLIHCKKR